MKTENSGISRVTLVGAIIFWVLLFLAIFFTRDVVEGDTHVESIGNHTIYRYEPNIEKAPETTRINEYIDPKVLREIVCLADNAFYEARNQGIDGMKAVIDVTLNRVNSKKYPDTVCDVVRQYKQFSWTFQRPQKTSKYEREVIWMEAYALAETKYTREAKGVRSSIIGRALWYHADYVDPYWNKSMKRVAKIKNHIFYASN